MKKFIAHLSTMDAILRQIGVMFQRDKMAVDC